MFFVDTSKLKDINDVNSDLNGVFRKCHEVKYKTVDMLERKVISSEKRGLTEHELRIRIQRTKNIYGLIRSFVFFEDNRRCIFCNRLVLKYYINKDIRENIDSLTYQVPRHGIAKIETSFYAVKKSSLDQLKSQLSNNRRKRSANFIYDSTCKTQQNGDHGDYPRSKKQLIDISYSLEKSNVHKVGDLLALNYELQDKIMWHRSDVSSDIRILGTDSLLGKF